MQRTDEYSSGPWDAAMIADPGASIMLRSPKHPAHITT